MAKNSLRNRLLVHKSSCHIYAQVFAFDGSVIASASTLDSELKSNLEGKTKTECAGYVGSLIAKRAVEKGIDKIFFDRGGFKYHGRVKALADAARSSGLVF
jgi:large subunit ribosomal protein L18